MKKIFGIEKYKFYLSDITTSIVSNDENTKNKIVSELSNNGYFVIDSKTIELSITVKRFLEDFNFDMKLIPYYELTNLLSKEYSSLNFETKIFLKIITLINKVKSKIVFDDVLTFLSNNQKYLVLKYLKENDISFFNFTSDVEEVLFTKYLIFLSRKGVLLEGSTKSVLNEEKIIKHNGFSLPVIVDLSHQLMNYGILDKEYYSVDRLVSELWK